MAAACREGARRMWRARAAQGATAMVSAQNWSCARGCVGVCMWMGECVCVYARMCVCVLVRVGACELVLAWGAAGHNLASIIWSGLVPSS